MSRAGHIVRDAVIALALSVAGALMVIAVNVAIDVGSEVVTLKRFGFTVEQSLATLSGGYALLSIGMAQILAIFIALFWPLASWRLPLLASVAGSALLSAAAYLLLRIDRSLYIEVAPTIAIIGISIILFLRIADWVFRRWQRRETQGHGP